MNKKTFNDELIKRGYTLQKVEDDYRVMQITENMIHVYCINPHCKTLHIIPFENFLKEFEKFDVELFTLKEFEKLLSKMNLTRRNILDMIPVKEILENGVKVWCQGCQVDHSLTFEQFTREYLNADMKRYFSD